MSARGHRARRLRARFVAVGRMQSRGTPLISADASEMGQVKRTTALVVATESRRYVRVQPGISRHISCSNAMAQASAPRRVADR